MVLNLHLEKRLADHRMHDAMCVAKLDCLLRGQFKEVKKQGWSSVVGIVLMPLMMITLPFRLAALFLKARFA